MVVEGGYLLADAVRSFLAITSFVARVIDLVSRLGTPDAVGALGIPLLVVVVVEAVFFKLFVELLELEAIEAARAPYLKLGRRVGEAFRDIDGSRVLDDLVGIDDGTVVLERCGGRTRGIEEDMTPMLKIGRDCWNLRLACPTVTFEYRSVPYLGGDVRELGRYKPNCRTWLLPFRSG